MLAGIPSSFNEKMILAAVANGDEKAFTQLFYAYKDRTYSIALRYSEDKFIAEEITQDVFTRVWKNRTTIAGLDSFASWLYTITRNRSITALQQKAREYKKRKESLNNNNEMYEWNGAERNASNSDSAQQLENTLSVLSPQQRKIFVLTRLEGYDRNEVADMLGLSPATVSVHLTIAIKKLKDIFSTGIYFCPVLYAALYS